MGRRGRHSHESQGKWERRQASGWADHCPECGKRRFLSRKAARKWVRANKPGGSFNVYRCGEFWHFGHTPYLVARGVLDRRDLR